mmetsp:Transcript_46227/g.74352  ORF Transcript_46227/g.74352 Transcript_46227/m.74352 type:complete len:107 (-) Transcript_46227:180-500(-)
MGIWNFAGNILPVVGQLIAALQLFVGFMMIPCGICRQCHIMLCTDDFGDDGFEMVMSGMINIICSILGTIPILGGLIMYMAFDSDQETEKCCYTFYYMKKSNHVSP